MAKKKKAAPKKAVEKKPDTELTEKQKAFSDQFVVDFNGTQAAIRAGYSKKTAESQASRLLRNVKVQEYIKSLQEKQREELEIEAQYITDSVKSIAERCMQVEEVRDKKGNIVPGEFQFREFGALKAFELLGKRIGYFEKDNRQRQAIVIPDLTEEQKKKLRDDFDKQN